MDFSNRNPQLQPAAPSAHPVAPTGNPTSGNRKSRDSFNHSKPFRLISGILVVAVVVLIVALVTYIGFGWNNTNQDKYVNTTKLQAVFLNTGQVYFGNIKALNDKYFVLDNIYYLQTSSTGSSTSSSSSDTSVTLVKLGCELHAPYDQMVINTSQVTFWENLQPTGQVAKAVATFEKDNPNGQKCTDQSSAPTGTSTSNGTVQGTGNTSTGTGTSTTNP